MSRPRREQTWALVRDRDISDNTTTTQQRASTFASGLSADSTTARLVVRRTSAGLDYHLSIPGARIDSATARGLAHAVGARLEPVESAPDLSFVDRVVVMRQPRKVDFARSSQVGADLAEVARILADTMSLDTWVAMTVRTPTKAEKTRWSRWLGYRLGNDRPTHHSLDTYPLVMSLYAGAGSTDDARRLVTALAAGLPGFDFSVRTARIAPTVAVSAWLLAAVLAGVATFTGFLPSPLGWIGAGVLAALGVATARGALPSEARTLTRGLTAGYLPPPRRHVGWVSRPTSEKRGADGAVTRKESAGSYPLHPTSFLVGPWLAVGLLAPQAGALSGGAAARSSQVPIPLTGPIGPLVARGTDGSPVHLSAEDGWSGVAALGKPGSGKSILMLTLVAWTMLEKTRPRGLPGFPGARNGIIAFEQKLDGATGMLHWAHALGSPTLLVEVANPASPRIDLLGGTGTIVERAYHFVNAMTYAWADGSIGAESIRSLRMVLSAGLACTPEIVAAAGNGIPAGRTPIYYAYLLLGMMGDEPAKALASSIRAAHERAEQERVDLLARGLPAPERSDASLAWEELAYMYAPEVTVSVRNQLRRAASNKMDALLQAEHFFADSRPAVSFDDIIEGHHNVVILTGADSRGNEFGEDVAQILSGMMMFQLHNTIRRRCAGWDKQNRWTSLFIDEFKELSGSNESIATWLRDKGRSYGVRMAAASQYPRQLLPAVLDSIMSYGVKAVFTQDSNRNAVALADEFAPWDAESLVSMPVYHAVMRATVGKEITPPFAIETCWWGTGAEIDVAAFIRDQGYEHVPAPTAPNTTTGGVA